MPINLLSPQLLISSMEMGQLEPMMKDVDSIVPEIQMGGMNSVSSNSESQQLSISNKQMGLMLEPVPDHPGLHGLSMTYSQMGQIANSNGTHGPQKLLSPSNHLGEIGSFPKNLESHQLLGSVKRKAPSELMSDNPATHQLSMLNKRVAHMEHRPWLQQAPAANRRSVQMESVHNAPLSPHLPAPNKRMVKIESGGSVHNAPGSPHLLAPNKKMVKMESFSGRSVSQRSSSQKTQMLQSQPSPKLQKESFESVRSKMRESLAAALALVNQQQDKCVDSGSKSQGEAGGIQGSTQENPQPAADAVYTDSKEPKENFTSSETCSIRKSDDGEGAGQMILADATTSASALTPTCDGKEFQSSNILRYEDVSFNDNLFVKDELLQGNGLSWVLDSEMEMTERKDIQPAEKQKLDHEEMDRRPEEQAVQSPEELASRIEAELFKLFGGVNKKYKEKGRSLLFNLKDRNNPELRERVMSGEIPPERLCSMTAEELASKELSEWRMAKAEELAQMVVLPDSEVDMRRLVKKTHKGEVEVEQYDSASVEVPVDTTSHAQSLPRSKEMEVSTPLKPDKPKEEGNASGEKSTIEDKTTQCTFTIPSTEATDFMQGLMVDDGLKDLPPIVSLDEFMESLDTEPPFEILPEKVTPISDKDDSETGSESKPSVLSPKNTVDAPPQKLDEIDTTDSKSDADLKTSGSHAVIKTRDHADTKSRNVCADVKSSGSPEKSVSRPLGTPKGERVWNGSLQLNLSPMASVIGIYKSGEKTSAKEWPGFLDIKGRVRLDAFEKFLQELPQSRSRAVMVVHFVPKEGSSEGECASLREVGESYIVDERVGFSEPCFGVEIYFCPPHNKTFDMLSKIIQKEHIEALNTIDNGLVGVVVWRKLTSPKSSSHHKHISKKQHYSSSTTTSSRRHDTNSNTNYTSKPAQARAVPPTNTRSAHDDDDVPPGFGPGASRDEDDLPEFNFSGGANPSLPQYSAQRPSRGPGVAAPVYPKSHTPSRPVDQMRELIQKYGQNNSSTYQASSVGVTVQPWNDDDDDIPEWQPNAPTESLTQYQPPQQRPVNNYHQQPMLRPHLPNQQHMGLVQQQQPLQSLQPTMNVAPNLQNPNLSWQQSPSWAPPAQGGGRHASNLSCQPEAGQFYGEPDRGAAAQSGLAWRPNAPKSRGF
ncbi:PREDICTED: PHD finger [Prunus dulcis]|uniref:PREDICTED: PHD finger n=1 Tax=Prunus dulcis TaxID=3755 RepID=A0A5E4G0E2_PRUDU|nr:uncharacterized protein LOC117633905 isoform X1 [Prunus dulcis]XP_034223642.1 uncharacterized protein LOC117633905 isoform X1 [Prunus dulcis]VVA33068.1 PREDICTED: PHD finger [Prunus dulcis]